MHGIDFLKETFIWRMLTGIVPSGTPSVYIGSHYQTRLTAL